MEKDWDHFKKGICTYYMNRAYLDRMKIRANKASYRDFSNSKESPSEYFIRKLELLQLVYNCNDRELINEIMSGTPSIWTTILTPHLYFRLEDFQQTVKFHEETLLRSDSRSAYLYRNDFSRNPYSNFRDQQGTKAKVNAVGWSEATKNPPFPKDDANVSKRGTPVSKGGRPCRHCGSGNHWDYECQYARKGERRVRSNHVVQGDADRDAQEEYDELYYGLMSDDEEEKEESVDFP